MSSNSGPPTKRKRQGRRNNDQIEYLVDYMLQHPNLASGKFFKMNSRDALQGSWEELVKELNEMRSNGQSEKNVKSWKESWRDQKTKTSKKSVLSEVLGWKLGTKKIIYLSCQI
ncbi:PREDICTED: uncharacterized protein LOC107171355 [Diuraphis noxia]|uniref:uncharacterized protein LOC107171355 n=1 Tax=Diuraphis noxia TaxID=143948 RepID=UPI000763A554|nr:PREDICTED: uncharacterized protein LOC107171355 [Diuraphis noxia]